MSVQFKLTAGATMLAEIQEYGSFDRETQRCICRSLELASAPYFIPEEWARSVREADEIRAQMRVYRLLPGIRASIPRDESFVDSEQFLFPLIAVTTFDLSSGSIDTFAQYRFLYERLLGAMVRPWLPAAFSAAAALPHFPVDTRAAFLASVQPALTDQWSLLEPTFFPQWLGKAEPVAL